MIPAHEILENTKVNYDENRNRIACLQSGWRSYLGSDKGEASRVMFYMLIALQMAQLQIFVKVYKIVH